jgi:hypothetical protein
MSHISNHDTLHSHARALEDLFFNKRDAELITKLKSELAIQEEEQKITQISGIQDEQVLRDLVHIGVTAESLLAMQFVPMIVVAWADRSVSHQEQQAILQAVTDEHLSVDSAAYRLIAQWLKKPPTPEVVTVWKEYVSALAKAVPSDTLKELQARTAKLCEQVAKATGGFLGFGKISTEEQSTIANFVGSWATN